MRFIISAWFLWGTKQTYYCLTTGDASVAESGTADSTTVILGEAIKNLVICRLTHFIEPLYLILQESKALNYLKNQWLTTDIKKPLKIKGL